MQFEYHKFNIFYKFRQSVFGIRFCALAKNGNICAYEGNKM